MDIDLPRDPDDTGSPASLSAPASPDDYVVQSGARAGQSVSKFPTDLLKIISRGGAKDPGGDSAAFARAVEAELERRAEALEAEAAQKGLATLHALPAAPQAAPRGVSADMPLPCGHPASMLERIEGEMFLSRCVGCGRLDDLEDAIHAIVPRSTTKIMGEVRLWERKHHSPKELQR